MLVSCIAFTNNISLEHVESALRDFEQQTYEPSQLIIINNRPTLSECQDLETIFRYNVAILDRPGYSNGQAIQTALQYSAGQIIACWPLDYHHFPTRLEKSVAALDDSKGLYIAPSLQVPTGIIRKCNDLSQIIPDLGVYKSPAYTINYNIDYGAWWQYPLMLDEQEMDIYQMHIELASKIS